MSTFVITLILAFVVIVIALTCLACGWLFKDKCTLRPGACGRAPPSTTREHGKNKNKKGCDICEGDEDPKP